MAIKTLGGLEERAENMLKEASGPVGMAARRKLSPMFARQRAGMARAGGTRGPYPFAPNISAKQPQLNRPPTPSGRVATSPMSLNTAPMVSGAVDQGEPGMPSGVGGQDFISDAVMRASQLTDALPDDLQTGMEITALAKAIGRLMKGDNALRDTLF